MSLSFGDFLMFLFHEKGALANEDQINRYIYSSTLGKMKLIAGGGALLGLIALLASFTPKHSGAQFVNSYRWIYSALTVIMVFGLVLFSYVKHDIEKRYKSLVWIMPFTSILVHIWAVLAMCVNAYALGFVNPSLYIATALLVPICTYMNPVAYIIVAGFTDIVMLIVYHNLMNVITSPAPLVVVIGTILVIKTSFALMLYFYQFTIRAKTITYEEQKKEISDLNNAQNRFFSSMSHEIRTPINTIIGLNEMILRERVSDEVAEDAANIRAASNMLLHIINDILDMSKISSGQMKLTPVAYRPGDMLSEIVGMLWLRCREKGLDFHIQIAPDIPSELYGDEVRIKQILINVLNNAIKYTKKGSVTLSIQSNGINDGIADIVYSVTDTGMGIRKEALPHLFMR